MGHDSLWQLCHRRITDRRGERASIPPQPLPLLGDPVRKHAPCRSPFRNTAPAKARSTNYSRDPISHRRHSPCINIACPSVHSTNNCHPPHYIGHSRRPRTPAHYAPLFLYQNCSRRGPPRERPGAPLRLKPRQSIVLTRGAVGAFEARCVPWRARRAAVHSPVAAPLSSSYLVSTSSCLTPSLFVLSRSSFFAPRSFLLSRSPPGARYFVRTTPQLSWKCNPRRPGPLSGPLGSRVSLRLLLRAYARGFAPCYSC